MNKKLPNKEETNMLQMSPWDFDQSPDGWRKLDAKRDYMGAADLIRKYISLHEDRILNQKGKHKVDIQVMYFHIGQLLASAGEDHFIEALQILSKGFYKQRKKFWNAYVSATIGFLESNEKKIDDAILILESSQKEDEKRNIWLSIAHNLKKALQTEERDYTRVMLWPRE